MTTTFCVSGAALKKAGLNVNASLSAGTILLSGSNFIVDTWINDAESIINASTKKNWTTAYGTLNVAVKDILRDAAASLAAINCVAYDPSGYTSREEATLIMDKCRDDYIRDLEILKDDDTITWMEGL